MKTRILGIACVLALASGLSLAAQQTKPGAKAAPVRSQWSGIYSDAQAMRGEPLYVEDCAYCHGVDLQGTVAAPPLTSAALAARWQGKTLADLFDYQQAFMPWNSPGGFRRAQNVDILAYMLKKGGMPAGSELPSEPEAQRQIRILAARP